MTNISLLDLKRVGVGCLLVLASGCELLQTESASQPEKQVEKVIEHKDASEGLSPTPVVVPAAVAASLGSPRLDNELSVAQEILRAMGLYSGRIDGIYGPKSRQALLDYQYQNALSLTGVLDLETSLSLFKSQ